MVLVPLTAALVSNSFNSESHCIGSLIIGHEDDVGNIHYLSVEGYRSSYPNLMRGYPVLRRNTISTFEIVSSTFSVFSLPSVKSGCTQNNS